MSIRGQSKDAWFSRWRQGTCPVHGVGFLDDKDGSAVEGAKRMKCPREECTVVVAQWPGKDEFHAQLGWIGGPEEIRTVFIKSNDVDPASAKPGRGAAMVRTSWRLEE